MAAEECRKGSRSKPKTQVPKIGTWGTRQTELAKKAGTTQSVIARLEDAEYAGHSLTMLERIAAACGVALKLRAEKKPDFDREVELV